MKRVVLTIAGLLVIAALFLYFRRPGPPEAPVVAVKRASLVQHVTTNGKVEPFDSFAVHVRAPSLVRRVLVAEGDQVRRGQPLADVDDAQAREALARAEAQLEAARADRGVIERGGTAAELAAVDSAIARARLEQEGARREVAVLERLVERQAAPRAELEQQRQNVRAAEAELAALERKRGSLLGPEDRQRLAARIREAEAALAQATTALRQLELRAPADGIVYSLALQPGAFYKGGELVARIGVLGKVRVRVLVDEPDLGRVRAGQPVRITWDAWSGLSWQGEVERLPSQVEVVGARSVGEVLCTIDNPGQRLLPGILVNAEIRTASAENALVVPREAVIREGGQIYVLAVNPAGVIERRAIRPGIQDLTRVQVLEGLVENQLVLVPSERLFLPGETVQPKVIS